MRNQTPFVLSHSALEKIFQGFHIPGFEKDGLEQRGAKGHGLLLFAFRGCLPAKSLNGWAKSISLIPTNLDYIHMRCTLGIWDPEHKRLFVAAGSTVPQKANVDKAAARKGRLKGKGTNQLEPGFYTDLTKGEHLQGKLNGHQALRQTANRFYRRSLTGTPYPPAAPLFYGNPYDNLHCGWNLDGQAPGYSSAGCMVVAGIPHCHRHESPQADQGPWKTFHDLLYAVDQRHFPILLLPAQAVQSLLEGAPAKKGGRARNLVYGSSGDRVKALQKELAEKVSYKGRLTGHLDARTYRAWMKSRGR